MTSLLRHLVYISCLGMSLLFPLRVVSADDLEDVKRRMMVEAQRLEDEFHSGRQRAYRMVRADSAQLREASDMLNRLMVQLQNDTVLNTEKRNLFLRTLKADLTNLRDIADAPRGDLSSTRPSRVDRPASPPTAVRPTPTATDPGKDRISELDRLLKGRREIVQSSRVDKLDRAERLNRVFEGVERSASVETLTEKFPDNWVELSKKRTTVKMTDTERQIMKALQSTIRVEYEGEKFQDVLDHLRKVTGLPLSADRRALEEAGISYETPINLKLTSTSRSILKKLLGSLGLAYVIKDEAVLITTAERASQMTVTKAYYIGDLAGVVGVPLDPVTSQLVMLERVNNIIAQITSKVDRSSWRVNNEDAPGTITFDPLTMSLIVKQSAEFHFMMGGR
ncbi:MAG: hypothetical protein SNJ75_04925 [Gemmataceae bacterium]